MTGRQFAGDLVNASCLTSDYCHVHMWSSHCKSAKSKDCSGMLPHCILKLPLKLASKIKKPLKKLLSSTPCSNSSEVGETERMLGAKSEDNP